MPIVLKSGSLNPLEPSGPLQACNGVALPVRHSVRYSLISICIFCMLQGQTFAVCVCHYLDGILLNIVIPEISSSCSCL